jgi:hypothetical protein
VNRVWNGGALHFWPLLTRILQIKSSLTAFVWNGNKVLTIPSAMFFSSYFFDIAGPFLHMLYCSKYDQCINCLVNTHNIITTVVVMKSCVFCDITPCIRLKVN